MALLLRGLSLVECSGGGGALTAAIAAPLSNSSYYKADGSTGHLIGVYPCSGNNGGYKRIKIHGRYSKWIYGKKKGDSFELFDDFKCIDTRIGGGHYR